DSAPDPATAPTWQQEFIELTLLDEEDVEALLTLDLPEPKIGEDISNAQGEVLLSEVELYWPKQRTALLIDEPEYELPGWQLICIRQENWLNALNKALINAKA